LEDENNEYDVLAEYGSDHDDDPDFEPEVIKDTDHDSDSPFTTMKLKEI